MKEGFFEWRERVTREAIDALKDRARLPSLTKKFVLTVEVGKIPTLHCFSSEYEAECVKVLDDIGVIE